MPSPFGEIPLKGKPRQVNVAAKYKNRRWQINTVNTQDAASSMLHGGLISQRIEGIFVVDIPFKKKLHIIN